MVFHLTDYIKRQLTMFKFEQTGLVLFTSSLYRRLHRCRKSVAFIQKCTDNHVIPYLAKCSSKYIIKHRLTAKMIREQESRNMTLELKNKEDIIMTTEQLYNKGLADILSHCTSNGQYQKVINALKSFVLHTERKSDTNRYKKLKKLIPVQKSTSSTIQMVNLTDRKNKRWCPCDCGNRIPYKV